MLVKVSRVTLPCPHSREASIDTNSPPASGQSAVPVKLKAAPPLRPSYLALIDRLRSDQASREQAISQSYTIAKDDEENETITLAPFVGSGDGQLPVLASPAQQQNPEPAGIWASRPLASGQYIEGTTPRWLSPQPAIMEGRASITIGQSA